MGGTARGPVTDNSCAVDIPGLPAPRRCCRCRHGHRRRRSPRARRDRRGREAGRDRATGLAASVLGGDRDRKGKQPVGDSGVSAALVIDVWRDSGAAQAALRVVFGLSRRGTYRGRARGCLDESDCGLATSWRRPGVGRPALPLRGGPRRPAGVRRRRVCDPAGRRPPAEPTARASTSRASAAGLPGTITARSGSTRTAPGSSGGRTGPAGDPRPQRVCEHGDRSLVIVVGPPGGGRTARGLGHSHRPEAPHAG